jgi:hypothetical protein
VKALSLWQPWAWLIIHGGKDVENRRWPTRYRGPLLVHASKRRPDPEYIGDVDEWLGWLPDVSMRSALARLPEIDEFDYGGIVGQVELVDCVTKSDSPWFVGPYGFVLRNPQPLPFRAVRGRQGLFEVTHG